MRHQLADKLEALADWIRPTLRGHIHEGDLSRILAEHNKAMTQIVEAQIVELEQPYGLGPFIV